MVKNTVFQMSNANGVIILCARLKDIVSIELVPKKNSNSDQLTEEVEVLASLSNGHKIGWKMFRQSYIEAMNLYKASLETE